MNKSPQVTAETVMRALFYIFMEVSKDLAAGEKPVRIFIKQSL
jgi:hypothetical protein